jgi:hypothetical protein
LLRLPDIGGGRHRCEIGCRLEAAFLVEKASGVDCHGRRRRDNQHEKSGNHGDRTFSANSKLLDTIEHSKTPLQQIQSLGLDYAVVAPTAPRRADSEAAELHGGRTRNYRRSGRQNSGKLKDG